MSAGDQTRRSAAVVVLFNRGLAHDFSQRVAKLGGFTAELISAAFDELSQAARLTDLLQQTLHTISNVLAHPGGVTDRGRNFLG